MVGVSTIYFLAQVFSCVCQFPVNRPFTDRLSRNGRRLHIITEGANSRILNQFRGRPSFNGQITGTSGNVPSNPNTLSAVPSFVNNIQKELERFGMRNIDLFSSSPGITNPPISVVTGRNLGNSGIIDIPNTINTQSNVLTNFNSGSTGNVKSLSGHLPNERKRQNSLLDKKSMIHGELRTNSHANSRVFSARDDIHNRLNNNISMTNPRQDIVPIMPSLFDRELNTNTVPENSNPILNTDPMISEADLLQMGGNELAALGNRAISLSSVVDTNFNSPNTQANPSTSAEEKLILALLERLLDIKENRRQRAIDSLPQTVGNSPTNQIDLRQSLPEPIGSQQLHFESALLNTNTANPLIDNQRRTTDTQNTQINIPVQSLPCQFRGCSSGHFCVTVALSALFSEFCPANSNDVCVCTPGCNFRNKFLPENAVERIGRCRRCFCETGRVYCRYTRRCRRLYRFMGWRPAEQQMFPLNNQ